MKQDPNYIKSFLNAGLLYQKLRDKNGIAKIINDLKTNFDSNPKALHVINVLISEDVNKRSEIEHNYEKIRKSDPKNMTLCYNFAVFLFQQVYTISFIRLIYHYKGEI